MVDIYGECCSAFVGFQFLVSKKVDGLHYRINHSVYRSYSNTKDYY